MNIVDRYNDFCATQRAKVGKPAAHVSTWSFCGREPLRIYKISQGYHWSTSNLERDIIAKVDNDHAEPLRALKVGEEHEIPQMGAPHIFVARVS